MNPEKYLLAQNIAGLESNPGFLKLLEEVEASEADLSGILSKGLADKSDAFCRNIFTEWQVTRRICAGMRAEIASAKTYIQETDRETEDERRNAGAIASSRADRTGW